VTEAVGSVRVGLTVRGPGGHAWEDRVRPSAVEALARIVVGIEALGQPEDRSANVGVIRGGEAINGRPREATAELELRASDEGVLGDLEAGLRGLVARCDERLSVDIHEFGRRPAGRIARDHPLVASLASAFAANGIAVTYTSASTDANAAFEVGIPAVATGLVRGGGTHTPEEWVDLADLGRSLRAIGRTLGAYRPPQRAETAGGSYALPSHARPG
jgi:acetylornithine deacetylase/succinyl-diaminopimelate desuccinylase-like protein